MKPIPGLFAILLAVLIVPRLVVGEVARSDPPATSTERLLLLSPSGPVLMELTVEAEGPSYRKSIDDRVRLMLPLADSNGDGRATWKEALADPHFTAYGQGSFWIDDSAAHRNRLIRWNDRNRDGAITENELRRMLEQCWPEYQTFLYEKPRRFQPELRQLLDTDRDGRLSPNELNAAERRFKSRDSDDNDLLTSDELTPRTVPALMPRSRAGRATFDEVFNVLTRRCSAAYTNLKSKYADSSGHVRATAFASSPGMFRSLDTNRNGVFEFAEAAGLHKVTPHVRLRLRLGIGSSRSMKLTIADTPFTRSIRPAPTVDRLGAAVLVDGVGCRFHFQLPDRVDDKVLKSAYARRQVYLSAAVSETPLFETVDLNSDGRLSLREIRTAGKRLRSLDMNGDGTIGADEMPTQITIRFDLGRRRVTSAQVSTSKKSRQSPANLKVPKWFHHMDKNRDGDVSRREFLGTKKQFDRLDKNRDGFIEPAESNR